MVPELMGQRRQALSAVDPDASLYFPDAQSVHDADVPLVPLYLPAAHAAMEAPLPVKPASAKQLSRFPDAAALLLSDGHVLQSDGDLDAPSVLYLPGEQLSHVFTEGDCFLFWGNSQVLFFSKVGRAFFFLV